MTVNKSVERSHAQQETATNCGDIGLQAVLSTVRLLPNIFLHRKTYYVSYYVSSISSRSSSAFPGAFCTENKTKEGTFSTQQVLRVIITCDCHMFMLFVRIYMKTVGSSAVDIYRLFTPKSLNELFLRIFQNPCGTFALSVSCHTNRHLPQCFDSITGLQNATAVILLRSEKPERHVRKASHCGSKQQ